MGEAATVAATLWLIHTHAHDAAEHSPILFITSPTMRCGKSNLLKTLGKLVPKGLSAANVTPATLFRVIERWHPTLLIDEVDTFVSDKPELRGVLNSGHMRSQAFVLRCVGDSLIPQQFSTWAPKAFAAIGGMHPTLEDRSIPIQLRRKLKEQKVERIPKGDGYIDLRRKCVRWALDNLEALRGAQPQVPQALNDRAQDNWEPLLAIADRAGGAWPQDAREAAVRLSGSDGDETPAILLLQDMKRLFEREEKAGGKNLSSDHVVAELGGMEDRPWPEYRTGKPITARQVAELLKPFKIVPRQVRVRSRRGRDRAKGYAPEQFRTAWKHYAPSAPEESEG